MSVAESLDQVRLDAAAGELGATSRLFACGSVMAGSGPRVGRTARISSTATRCARSSLRTTGRSHRSAHACRGGTGLGACIGSGTEVRAMARERTRASQKICAQPDLSRPIYRLISVHRLRKAGSRSTRSPKNSASQPPRTTALPSSRVHGLEAPPVPDRIGTWRLRVALDRADALLVSCVDDRCPGGRGLRAD